MALVGTLVEVFVGFVAVTDKPVVSEAAPVMNVALPGFVRGRAAISVICDVVVTVYVVLAVSALLGVNVILLLLSESAIPPEIGCPPRST